MNKNMETKSVTVEIPTDFPDLIHLFESDPAKAWRTYNLRKLRFKDKAWATFIAKNYDDQKCYIGQTAELPLISLSRPLNIQKRLKNKRSTMNVFTSIMDLIPDKADLTAFPSYLLEQLERDTGRQLTLRDLMGLRMVRKVLEDGDVSAFNAILDRTDGKPVQVNHNLNRNENYTDFLDAKAKALESSTEGEDEKDFQDNDPDFGDLG